MLRTSRKTLLAIEAVVDVALHARPNPVQSRELTKRQGVPQRYLEQVMQQLVHEGILRGVRGPKGGYTLARERRRITVGEIVRIIDAMERKDETTPVSALNDQIIRPIWDEIGTLTLQRLDHVTVEQLCENALANGLGPDTDKPRDFTI
jgi:Rrf2 family protein